MTYEMFHATTHGYQVFPWVVIHAVGVAHVAPLFAPWDVPCQGVFGVPWGNMVAYGLSDGLSPWDRLHLLDDQGVV